MRDRGGEGDGEYESGGAEPEAAPVEVPVDALSEGALHGLLEEFATRDGTDYGAVERTLGEKVAELRAQLARGEIAIFFDPASERTQLVRVE